MNREHPLTFGDWMVIILIMAIPGVNLIALVYWAASSSTNISKQNYARASITWFFIGLVIFFVLSATGLLVGLSGPGVTSGS